MLILAMLAMVTAPSVVFSEDFKVGQQLDINQGFYVCQNDNPRDLMERLLEIKNDRARHQYAQAHGCSYQAENHQDVYQISYIQADTCMDRSNSFQLTSTGQKSTVMCGREGHQITVVRAKETKTVIWLSFDTDFD